MTTSKDQAYTIDLIDGVWAVLEAGVGETFNVPKAWLPEDANEGNVLRLSLEPGAGESKVRFILDLEETGEGRERARELRESLPKAPDGDLERRLSTALTCKGRSSLPLQQMAVTA